MDLKVIAVIFILSSTEYSIQEKIIHEPCVSWYNTHVVHDREKNIHYISNRPVMGYICKEYKEWK
tara:strand:+ start:7601 stop:7795 length:195 start_codon:yes stop_codon:yes gene_type:complete